MSDDQARRDCEPNVFNAEVGPQDFETDALRAFRQEQLDLYLKFVDSGEKVSDRRGAANAFFLSINSIVMAFVAFLWEDRSDPTQSGYLAIPLAGGLILCLAWFASIRSHRQLNGYKWDLVGEIEAKLVLQPWYTEWELAENGKNPRKYLQLTDVETAIPVLFASLYAISFVLVM